MTFEAIALILISVLIISIIVFALIARKNETSRFRWSFLSGHLGFILIFGFIAYLGSGDAQGGLIFLIPIAIDLPISLLFFAIRDVIPGLSPHDFLGPFLFFAIAGSLQYFGFGFLIDKILGRKRKKELQQAA